MQIQENSRDQKMSCREGDWMCPACQHLNFKKRDSCHRCSCPKYASTEAEISSYVVPRAEVLAGDWYCAAMNCGSHNYASRTNCYKCGASKDYFGYGAAGMMAASASSYAYDAIPGWKPGDWICSRLGCSTHNYACRLECYKCKTPRDYGGSM